MMNNKLGLVVMIGIVGVAIFIALYFLVVRPTSPASSQKILSPSTGQVTVSLAELNSSGESGTAVLEEKNGYVIVTLQVTGNKSAIQPAHLHANNCPGLGAIVYPLKNVVNGTSETTLNVTMEQLKKQLPLAVNVHESTDNYKKFVVCGEIAIP